MSDDTCNKCDYPHSLKTDCYIPEANFYVVSTDRFMSGWGYSKGLDNVCIVPCDTIEEAEKVYNYVLSRRDQMRVRINTTKPRTRSHWLISNLSAWKRQAGIKTE
jgi:hypothetical protein